MDATNIDQTTEQAIKEFYIKNNFSEDGGVNEKYAWIKFGFFSIPIPNTQSRKDNVYLHDINHVVTGNNTTWKGESAVSAWEIASGGWGNLYFIWLLTLWAMGLGVVFYPSNVFKSFQKGLTMRNGLICGLSKNEINQLSISDLRKQLSGKPKSKKNTIFWMIFSFLIFVMPFLIGLFIIWTILSHL